MAAIWTGLIISSQAGDRTHGDCRIDRVCGRHSGIADWMMEKVAAQPVVMHVREAMSIGGAERLILNLLKRRELGEYDLRLASFVRTRDGAGEDFVREAAATGVPIERIKLSRRWDFGNIIALWKIVRRHEVRLLHTHGYRSDMVGAIVSVLTGVPMVASAHGFTAADANVSRNEKIGRFFLRAAGKIICVSDNVRDTLIKSGLPERKLVMIPNAVDFGHFSNWIGGSLRKDWQIGSDDIVIGSAGRLSPEKAHINLIKACSQLAPAPRTFIVGTWQVAVTFTKLFSPTRHRVSVGLLSSSTTPPCLPICPLAFSLASDRPMRSP